MLDDGDLIYRQIEAKADLHEPSVYALLSFYHSLEHETDPLDGQFVALSTVPQRSSQTKIFAVGLLPPAISMDKSRLLDRSGTIRAEGAYADLIESIPDVGSSSTGDLPGETSGLPTSMPIPIGPTHTDSPDFFDQFVVMCNRLGCQPEELAKVIQSECGWKEHATAKDAKNEPVAKGLIQLVRKTAKGLGMTDEEYERFEQCSRLEQLPWIEKFYKQRARGKSAGQIKAITFGGFNNPDNSIWHQTAVPSPPYKKPELQRKAYALNRNVDKVPDYPGQPIPKGYLTTKDLDYQVAKHKINPTVLEGIKRAKERLGMGSAEPLECSPDAPPAENWSQKGSKEANEAAKVSAKTAGTDLNTTGLGLMFSAAQQVTIRLMRDALKTIADTPPLRMLVNPQSFRVTSEKLIANHAWGRNGHIIEHWGDQPDKIEGSGKIAAFYSRTAGYDTPGLSRTNRQFSLSYQNFLSLFLLYRNNGGVWLPDPLAPVDSHVNNLSVVGSVYLYYDGTLYLGSFDSLSVNETEDSPYSLEYSFSFTVRASYLFDRAEDPGKPLAALRSSASMNNAQPVPEVPLPTLRREDDPIFGINDGEIGDDLEGID